MVNVYARVEWGVDGKVEWRGVLCCVVSMCVIVLCMPPKAKRGEVEKQKQKARKSKTKKKKDHQISFFFLLFHHLRLTSNCFLFPRHFFGVSLLPLGLGSNEAGCQDGIYSLPRTAIAIVFRACLPPSLPHAPSL